MDKMRSRRKKHLSKLCDMSVGEIILHIENLKTNSAKALLSAMDSTSGTNCYWVEYRISKKFRQDVVDRINRNRKAPKVSSPSEETQAAPQRPKDADPYSP